MPVTSRRLFAAESRGCARAQSIGINCEFGRWRVVRGNSACISAADIAAGTGRRAAVHRPGRSPDRSLAHAGWRHQLADFPQHGPAVYHAHRRPCGNALAAAARRRAAGCQLHFRRQALHGAGFPGSHLHQRAAGDEGRQDRQRNLPQQQRRKQPLHRLVHDQVSHVAAGRLCAVGRADQVAGR